MYGESFHRLAAVKVVRLHYKVTAMQRNAPTEQLLLLTDDGLVPFLKPNSPRRIRTLQHQHSQTTLSAKFYEKKYLRKATSTIKSDIN